MRKPNAPWQSNPLAVHLADVFISAAIGKPPEATISLPSWWFIIRGMISFATISWGALVWWGYRQVFYDHLRKQEAEQQKRKK